MEDLIKAKDEELARYAKIKEMLAGQLKQTKQELQTLKDQLGTQLQQKEEELAKELKLKDVLIAEAKKAKIEVMEMKQQLLQAQEEVANACKSSYPDLEKKIKELEELNKELKADNEKLKASVTKLTTEEDINKVMGQLKTGMFKLGEQNAETHQKIDALAELVGKLGTFFGPGFGASSPPKTSSPQDHRESPSPSSTTPSTPENSAPSPEPPAEEGGFRRRKPSEIMGATMESQKAEEKEKTKEEPAERGRRPSDLLKERGTPEKTAHAEPSSREEKEKEKDKDKPPAPAEPKGIQTIPYPADGVIGCPKCGARTYQEMENRNKIIAFTPTKKYGKKYYCKKCHHEWDYQY